MKLAYFFLFLLAAFPVSASWEYYEGTTKWEVDITEAGCGTDKTERYPFTIEHQGTLAIIYDPVHGTTRAAFKGDRLDIPGRTLRDGVGFSKLTPASVQFTCKGFNTKYGWDYQDQNVRCSGTTAWRGYRIDTGGCPLEATKPQTIDIKQHFSKEERARAILAKNPKDFWANWDMAEVNKERGDFKDYFTYLNRATADEKIYGDTREKLMAEARRQLGLTQDPTPDTVMFLRTAQENAAQGGIVYDVRFPKPDEKSRKNLFWLLWNAWVPDSSSVVERIVKE